MIRFIIQERKFVGGSQQISDKIADILGGKLSAYQS